jgi:hypothetical protein
MPERALNAWKLVVKLQFKLMLDSSTLGSHFWDSEISYFLLECMFGCVVLGPFGLCTLNLSIKRGFHFSHSNTSINIFKIYLRFFAVS